MMVILPTTRPDDKQRQALEQITQRFGAVPPCVIGIRGYFKDQNLDKTNDMGVFDDAIFVYTMDLISSFNANTDPSNYTGDIAELVEGMYSYKIGIHGLSKPIDQQYEALVQAGPVNIKRANGSTETGYFGINIHRGGIYSTGSLGCQTIYKPQWDEFISTVKQVMAAHRITQIPYLLLSESP